MDGALALASPVRYGQKMELSTGSGSVIDWKAFDSEGNQWFSGQFSLFDFSCEKTTDEEIAQNITELLKTAVRMNPDFLAKWKKYRIKTTLEFDRSWGLGSSSTMIYNLATWAEVNPILIGLRVYGGSGYDIACAGREEQITYKSGEESIEINPISFKPPYAEEIFFAWSGKKVSTKEAIKNYEKIGIKKRKKAAEEISEITSKIIIEKSKKSFETLLNQHEDLISKLIDMPTIHENEFPEYTDGIVKSLGAWGGDFFMYTTSDKEAAQEYFKSKGIEKTFSFNELLV